MCKQRTTPFLHGSTVTWVSRHHCSQPAVSKITSAESGQNFLNKDVWAPVAPQGLHFQPDFTLQARESLGPNFGDSDGPSIQHIPISVSHFAKFAWPFCIIPFYLEIFDHLGSPRPSGLGNRHEKTPSPCRIDRSLSVHT